MASRSPRIAQPSAVCDGPSTSRRRPADPKPEGTSLRILSTHHVGLSTDNFQRLRDFYIETLGLPVVGGFDGHEIVFVEAGGSTIELIGEVPPTSPRAPASAGFARRGWQHLAWEVADVDAAYAELSSRGIAFSVPPEDFPADAPAMRIAFFSDPDGNLIELIQPLGARYPGAPPSVRVAF